MNKLEVSVPIRGLFNLTSGSFYCKYSYVFICFRPHQGII